MEWIIYVKIFISKVLAKNQIFSLSRTHVMLINSSFTFVSIVGKISPFHNC